MEKPTLYIIAGHNSAHDGLFNFHERDPGVVKYDSKGNEIDNEHWLMERLIAGAVNLLKKRGYDNFQVLPFDLSLKQKIEYLNAAANGTNPVLEFHANASSNKSVSGSEVFYAKYRPRRSTNYARDLAQITSANMGIKNRGAKTEENSQHSRLAIVSDTVTYDFVVELGFFTNDDDYEKMNEKHGVETVYQCCKYILDKKN